MTNCIYWGVTGYTDKYSHIMVDAPYKIQLQLAL